LYLKVWEKVVVFFLFVFRIDYLQPACEVDLFCEAKLDFKGGKVMFLEGIIKEGNEEGEVLTRGRATFHVFDNQPNLLERVQGHLKDNPELLK